MFRRVLSLSTRSLLRAHGSALARPSLAPRPVVHRFLSSVPPKDGAPSSAKEDGSKSPAEEELPSEPVVDPVGEKKSADRDAIMDELIDEEDMKEEEDTEEAGSNAMPYTAALVAILAAVGSLGWVGYWLYTKRAILDSISMSQVDLGYIIFTSYKKAMGLLKRDEYLVQRMGGKSPVAEESTLKMHQSEDSATALFAMFGPRARASVEVAMRAVPGTSFNQWQVHTITVDFLNGETYEIDLLKHTAEISDRQGQRTIPYPNSARSDGLTIDWKMLQEELSAQQAAKEASQGGGAPAS